MKRLALAILIAAPCIALAQGWPQGYTRGASGGGGGGGVSSVGTGAGLTGGPITTTGTIATSNVVNAQTGTTYTILATDHGKLVTLSNAASIAVTLPQAGASFPNGWSFWVENIGAGTVTITPTTSTIDGATTLALTTNQGVIIVSDGSNYFTVRGIGGSGGGNVNNSGTPTAGQTAEWTSATVIQGVAVTGTGSYVKSNSPTLVTPALGTPASGVLTNATGLPIGTGVSGLGANVAAALANAKDATGGLAGACPTAGQANIGGTCQAVRPIIYSGQKALGTSAIASGACATVITQAATGLATTSTIDLTWAATPVGVTGYSPSVTSGRLSVDAYPTANQVNISVCNPTASSITPAAMTVNVVAY